MLNHHKKFNADFPQFQMMSYSKFCHLRSLRVLHLTLKDRDTCLCSVYAECAFLVTKANAEIEIIG